MTFFEQTRVFKCERCLGDNGLYPVALFLVQFVLARNAYLADDFIAQRYWELVDKTTLSVRLVTDCQDDLSFRKVGYIPGFPQILLLNTAQFLDAFLGFLEKMRVLEGHCNLVGHILERVDILLAKCGFLCGLDIHSLIGNKQREGNLGPRIRKQRIIESNRFLSNVLGYLRLPCADSPSHHAFFIYFQMVFTLP